MNFIIITRGVHRTHTPRGTSTGQDAAMISANAHRKGAAIAYTVHVFVYGHIQGVGVTTYRIYVTIVKLERWGQTLRIIETTETIVTMSVKYINRGKYCFLAATSKREISKCTACPVLDGTLRSRRGGANVMNSYASRK